jgi:hypothetical protein
MACMNVLLTLGHPRKVSLCAALCAAYREGACGGANVETLVLADLAFDPYVRVESPEQQPLEPGLEIARQLTGGSAFASAIFWWGLLCLFALQVAAVPIWNLS